MSGLAACKTRTLAFEMIAIMQPEFAAKALRCAEMIEGPAVPLDAPKAEERPRCVSRPYEPGDLRQECVTCGGRWKATEERPICPGPEKKARRMQGNPYQFDHHQIEHDWMSPCDKLGCQPVEAAPVEPESRNAALLKSFTAYCEAHPEQRFMQALQNWTEAKYIEIDGKDSFYWEGVAAPVITGEPEPPKPEPRTWLCTEVKPTESDNELWTDTCHWVTVREVQPDALHRISREKFEEIWHEYKYFGGPNKQGFRAALNKGGIEVEE